MRQRICLLIAGGLLLAAPAASEVVFSPVKGFFETTTLDVSCPSLPSGCIACINDENTTADHKLMMALGTVTATIMSTGLAEGVLRPFVDIDGVRLPPALLPCGSFLRSGIRWSDLPFAPNCPDTAKGVSYQVGGEPQVVVSGDGSVIFDIPITEADEIPFRFTLCSQLIYWGAGCNISGSSTRSFRLHTPAVPRAFEAGPGDAPPLAFPSSEIAFDFTAGPGGKVSVARVLDDVPGTPPVDHLNGYWDIHTDMPAGTFATEITFDIDPAALPEGVEVGGVGVATFDQATQNWSMLAASVDAVAMTASVTTDRMSKFVLVEAGAVPNRLQSWGELKVRYR